MFILFRSVTNCQSLPPQTAFREHTDPCSSVLRSCPFLAGGKALARVLQTSPSLTSLNLRLNSLGDEGGAHIGQALAENSRLKVRDLRLRHLDSNPSLPFLARRSAHRPAIWHLITLCLPPIKGDITETPLKRNVFASGWTSRAFSSLLDSCRISQTTRSTGDGEPEKIGKRLILCSSRQRGKLQNPLVIQRAALRHGR